MTDRRAIPANSRTTNILAGLPFEFVVTPSIIRIYLTGSAIGLKVDILIGGESVVSDSEVNAQNRMPLRPDDLLIEFGGSPGDRIFVAWRNSTGAVINGFLLVDVIPL